MLINNSRYKKAPRGVYFSVVASTGSLYPFDNFFDTVVVEKKRSLEGTSLIDYRTVVYPCFHNAVVVRGRQAVMPDTPYRNSRWPYF
ncbi:unknown [Prevotella sp. CAG:924]|nr:unknown [Prevotella sp. CAG:924]